MDSVGPLAHSVSCCSVLDSVITGGTGVVEPAHDAGGLRIGVLEGYTTEILDAETAASWEQALRRLEDRGARLVRLDIAEFRELPTINRNGGLVGAEAWALHRKWIETRSAYYDPWILMRFDAGKAQSAADYIDVLHHRERVVASVRKQTAQFDVLALPTVQIKPPVLSDMDDLKVSNATNHMCLRNTAIGNFLDRPSISIPCHAEGDAPAGFMLMGRRGHDRKLFSIAAGVEEIVRLT
jgi:aspartyl-tRNA(Asn)/glutamyl-tRNA(Gln) amidotransferase subunit A